MNKLGYVSKIIMVVWLSFVSTTELFADTFFSEQNVDQLHSDFSERVSDTAKWLDAFFVDPVFDDEQNESRVKLQFDMFAEKDEPIDFNVRANVRVLLPGTQKKLNLFISGQDSDNDGLPTEGGASRLRDTDPEIGLKYFFHKDFRESISVGGGVKRRDGTYGLYIKPRYRKVWQLDNWDSRYTQSISYHTSAGFEIESRVDFERLLSDEFFFRFTSQLDWYEVDPGVFYNVNVSLRHSIDRNTVMSYEWNNYFETKPEHVLDVSVLRIKYRKRFWKEWMFYEIAPEIAFPNDKDHKITPGLFFRLEMVFGYGNAEL